MPRIVICRGCGRHLPSDEQTPGLPCSGCGEKAREYQLNVTDSFSVTDEPADTVGMTLIATANAPAPSAVIEQEVEKGTFTRSVTWSQTGSGAWFAEVRDRHGNLVAVEVGLDAVDTLVVLSDHLLPPDV